MAIVHLPDALAERLRVEAARRRTSVDEVVVELLVASLPGEDALEAFLGAGRSRLVEPLDIHAARAVAAERRVGDGV